MVKYIKYQNHRPLFLAGLTWLFAKLRKMQIPPVKLFKHHVTTLLINWLFDCCDKTICIYTAETISNPNCSTLGNNSELQFLYFYDRKYHFHEKKTFLTIASFCSNHITDVCFKHWHIRHFAKHTTTCSNIH
jgi:hypothetical protein